MNSNNIKAHYRQARIFLDRDDYDKCQSVISKLTELKANDEANELSKELKKKV